MGHKEKAIREEIADGLSGQGEGLIRRPGMASRPGKLRRTG